MQRQDLAQPVTLTLKPAHSSTPCCKRCSGRQQLKAWCLQELELLIYFEGVTEPYAKNSSGAQAASGAAVGPSTGSAGTHT